MFFAIVHDAHVQIVIHALLAPRMDTGAVHFGTHEILGRRIAIQQFAILERSLALETVAFSQPSPFITRAVPDPPIRGSFTHQEFRYPRSTSVARSQRRKARVCRLSAGCESLPRAQVYP